jgi:glycosyltransferase involved in cell wall biosynthesis
MLRVLISASTFPLARDDARPRYVADLADALAADCRVSVLAPGAAGAPRFEALGAVDVHRFTYFLPARRQALAYGAGIPDNLARSPWLAAQLPSFLACQTAATSRLVRRLGIDVVSSHWILPQGLSSALARASGSAFRHVLTLHGGDAYALARLPLGAALARFILARTDAVFAASSNVKRVLDDLLGGDSGAVVQPVGVHVRAFAEAAGGPAPGPSFAQGHLLYVGRLVPIKGVSVLLRAFARLAPAQPGLGLVIVGDGPEAPALRAQAEALGIGRAVAFRGAQPHAEIARLLRACRAAVVPSVVAAGGRTEGMPAVVLEALAAGARLVATAVGGIPDVVRDGESGWLCRPGDELDLAAKIETALAAANAAEVAQRARATALRFDWAAVAARYREAFAPPRRGAASG